MDSIICLCLFDMDKLQHNITFERLEILKTKSLSLRYLNSPHSVTRQHLLGSLVYNLSTRKLMWVYQLRLLYLYKRYILNLLHTKSSHIDGTVLIDNDLKKKKKRNYFPLRCSSRGRPFLAAGLSFPLFNNGCVSENRWWILSISLWLWIKTFKNKFRWSKTKNQ